MGELTERDVRMALTDIGLAGDERIGAAVAERGALGAFDWWLSDPAHRVLAARTKDALARLPDTRARAAQCGAVFLAPGDPDWPASLDDLDTMVPAGIWCRGDAGALGGLGVSVVGARAATTYGERVASDIASAAAHAGAVTVSGGAYGIDSAAHRGALAAGGRTVVVLACGVDVVYPASNAGLFDRAATRGALISESAPGTQVRKHLFLTRNRIIAALCPDTVVVEAALRSGALSTGNWAAVLGRTLWGVPGPIVSPASAGVNRAIAEGTMTALADIADLARTWRAAEPVAVQGLGASVLQAIDAGAETLADVMYRVPGVQVTAVQGALTLLELGGHVTRVAGGWRRG